MRDKLVSPYRHLLSRINLAVMSRVFQWFLLIIFLPPVLFSCTPFAPAARLGQEETAVPDSFSIKDSIQDPKQRWWETVGDEQLNSFDFDCLNYLGGSPIGNSRVKVSKYIDEKKTYSISER